MKMRSFGRRNALVRGSGRGVPLFVGIVVLLVALFVLRIFVPGVLTALARPFWKVGTTLSHATGGFENIFSDKNALATARDQLKNENTILTNQNAELTARVHDLERLVGSRTEPAHRVLAGVLVGPPVTPYDVLIVDAGKNAGVPLGAFAFTQGGVPVGTVAEVAGNSARVGLFSTSGRETPAWAGEARVALTLRGAGGGAFSADVPRDASIHEGDQVYVAAAGAVPIATVSHIKSDPSSPRAELSLQPVVNPFSITWVEIGQGL